MTLRYDVTSWIEGGMVLCFEMGDTRENELEDKAGLA